MFSFDESIFLKQYASTYRLQDGPAMGLGRLLSLVAGSEWEDIRWAAYLLATVKHECADLWHPIEEHGLGKGRPYGVSELVTDPAGNRYTNAYYGRGYVQLTWKDNYQRLGKAVGLGDDLVYHPEKTLASDISYRITSFGMQHGAFTGKKLSDYIHGETANYRDARHIINGYDQADRIADYARKLEVMLRGSLKD